MRRLAGPRSIAAATLVMIAPLTATANGLGEDRSWQFETDSQRAVSAGIADLILRRQNGYYGSFGDPGTAVTCQSGSIGCGTSGGGSGAMSIGNMNSVSGGGTITGAQSNSGSVQGTLPVGTPLPTTSP
ncbi:MAG TPA: hypothetical protein VGD08_09450 [Stellaceae bacterium]